MQRIALTIVLLSLSVAAAAEAIPNPTPPPRDRQRVDLLIQDDSSRALQQMKVSVCGTGPIYVGRVDDPIYVKPSFHPACTMSDVSLP
jgi:hypothetical protein